MVLKFEVLTQDANLNTIHSSGIDYEQENEHPHRALFNIHEVSSKISAQADMWIYTYKPQISLKISNSK